MNWGIILPTLYIRFWDPHWFRWQVVSNFSKVAHIFLFTRHWKLSFIVVWGHSKITYMIHQRFCFSFWPPFIAIVCNFWMVPSCKDRNSPQNVLTHIVQVSASETNRIVLLATFVHVNNRTEWKIRTSQSVVKILILTFSHSVGAVSKDLL